MVIQSTQHKTIITVEAITFFTNIIQFKNIHQLNLVYRINNSTFVASSAEFYTSQQFTFDNLVLIFFFGLVHLLFEYHFWYDDDGDG